jgi:hypothetical protein
VRLIFRGLAALIAAGFLLAVPSRADAQIEWIRRLSGPEYAPAVFARAGVCFGRNDAGEVVVTCAELAGAVVRRGFPQLRADSKWELQLATAVTRGTNGDNTDAGISDTRIWVVEPQLRALYLGEGTRPAISMSSGFGWHTFNGGTIPEKFSRAALILTAGVVYPNPRADKWSLARGQNEPTVRLFFEGGGKVRWFPNGLLNSEFGGNTADDETDTIGFGLYAMFGVRFGR